jgi:hypothetical protein
MGKTDYCGQATLAAAVTELAPRLAAPEAERVVELPPIFMSFIRDISVKQQFIDNLEQ